MIESKEMLKQAQTYIENLDEKKSPEIYKWLTGKGPDQRHLKPETLRKYMVGATKLKVRL
jgi:hypothetical protein